MAASALHAAGMVGADPQMMKSGSVPTMACSPAVKMGLSSMTKRRWRDVSVLAVRLFGFTLAPRKAHGGHGLGQSPRSVPAPVLAGFPIPAEYPFRRRSARLLYMKTNTLSREVQMLEVLRPAAACEPQVPGDIRAEFSRRLRAWRERLDVPLKGLAFDLGVSVSTVAAWENGTRFPGIDNLIALAQHTGIPACQFVCASESCQAWGGDNTVAGRGARQRVGYG